MVGGKFIVISLTLGAYILAAVTAAVLGFFTFATHVTVQGFPIQVKIVLKKR